METKKGIYILMFYLGKNIKIRIGKLGTKYFLKGHYAYIGSARGSTSSSLPNRIGRHLNKNKKKHWHIDFLLANKNTQIEKLITIFTTENIECKINALLKKKLEAMVPVKGFGTSDCRQNCQSHLLYVCRKEKPEDSIYPILEEAGIKYNLFTIPQF
jgi:Uri superfamily endonuclease